MAWPKLVFGWCWPLRTSAAGLVEGPRGIFRRQDAPKKPFKYTLERRYSARVAEKLRARGGATRYSHSAETRLWGYNRGVRSHAKARRDVCALFRERSGRGGSSMRGCFAFGANAPNAGIAWPKPGFGWCWPFPPPRLAWGTPGVDILYPTSILRPVYYYTAPSSARSGVRGTQRPERPDNIVYCAAPH
jgi:hypothetical protein